jgi:ABC-type polysaccharide/polyol phosphate transport system ATPase subunit
MYSDNPIISIRNLSKTFRLFASPSDRLKQSLCLGLKRFHREHTALQDISLTINRGESVGIIGRNGSGKSTLLHLICGILKPSSGSVEVTGRVAALLELGAGFNPELTGRENVYFQGAIQGFTREEMDQRIEGITDFADIGKFLDQPMRMYSSGMYVRLAFASAIHADPEILVVDEALAVGDVAFQKKCYDHIYALQERGVTIVLVSHNPYQIERLCHRVGLLHEGRFSGFRPAKETLTLYQELTYREHGPGTHTKPPERLGTQELRFERVGLEDAKGIRQDRISSGQPLRLTAEVMADHPLDNVRLRFEICDAANDVLSIVTTIGLTEERSFNGRHHFVFHMENCPLTSGWYYLNAIAVGRNLRLDTWQRALEFHVQLDDPEYKNLSTDQGIFVSPGHWEID